MTEVKEESNYHVLKTSEGMRKYTIKSTASNPQSRTVSVSKSKLNSKEQIDNFIVNSQVK